MDVVASRRIEPGARVGPMTTRVAAVVVAVAAIGLAAPTASDNEGPSYRAGYAAASDATLVRSALHDGGLSSAAFCEELIRRRITAAPRTDIRRSDFRRGCLRAVHDVME
ncbi:hypothetical protein DVS77_10780 [Mycolicibacterium moriokaense]|nr:hypothetical protein DVS77_10780 [Mycolicibacterium moriokaense]